MKKGLFLIICSLVLSGCINLHNKADKFETYPEAMLPFTSNKPISIVIPQNAEKNYLVENLNIIFGKGLRVHYDLNDLHEMANEHLKENLERNKVPVISNSSKYLKFTITKIQTEQWSVLWGVYLYFSVETSDGYKRDYKVQDQSAANFGIDRAVGGSISRAVETIFQDPKIIAFIESK